MNETLALRGIVRRFRQGRKTVEVLRGADLEVRAGETVALVAPSGAGKSTLLHIAGLLDTPTAGEVWIEGKKFSDLGDGARTAARRRLIGFVYQFHHLLPEFSAEENLAIPAMVAGHGRAGAAERARALLDRLGLARSGPHIARPSSLAASNSGSPRY